MIRAIFSISFFVFFFVNALAQSGVYKTVEDYENKKLSYQEVPDEKYRLHTDIPFNQSVVKVVSGSESRHLIKTDLYGYKKKMHDFRFYDDKSYKIVDPAYFFIYSREINVAKGKAKTRETKYYFSKDADSPIMELTIKNLKYAFPSSRKFHDLLDLQFRNDNELMKYDSFHKEYKLKSVFIMNWL